MQSNGTQLNRVNFTKSLGVLIDENLTWSNISYQGNIKKNSSAIGSIKNELATVFLLQPCIISITGELNPASTIVVLFGVEKLQRLQNQAARILTQSSYDAVANQLIKKLG